MNKKNIKIAFCVLGLILMFAAGFFVGKSHGQKNRFSADGMQFGARAGMNTSGRMGAGAARGVQQAGFGQMGEVMSIGDGTMTIKLRDGGTQIVFLGAQAVVTKSAPGTIGDIAVGSTVTVSGTKNSDGSLTAKTVQLRPAPVMQQ